MKKQFITVLTAALLTGPLFSIAQNEQQPETNIAQEEAVKADWVSDKGYWVAEGNVNNPKSHTIYFYNNNRVLVYQEKLEGVKLNFKKRKTMLKMKEALEASIAAWNGSKIVASNQHIVAERLGILSR